MTKRFRLTVDFSEHKRDTEFVELEDVEFIPPGMRAVKFAIGDDDGKLYHLIPVRLLKPLN